MASACCTILIGFVIFIIWKLKSFYDRLRRIPKLPQLDENQPWGLEDSTSEQGTPQPFHIKVPSRVLDDLRHRLENAREFVAPLLGAKQEYGLNSTLLKEIVDYWKTDYKWSEREAYLNKYPQFTLKVQGLNLHYVHIKPEVKPEEKILPIMLLHGWPTTPRDFYELIPHLIKPIDGVAFEVVAPSLPGYGFSEGTRRMGLGPAHTAVIMKNLMQRLGFSKFYLQGGDWGSVVASYISILYPENILGLHLNMTTVLTPIANLKLFVGSYFPRLVVDEENQKRIYPLGRLFRLLMNEMGYMHIQATKPDTIGVALNDSPVGLAAYFIEKFITWTNPEWNKREDGGLTLKYTYDTLLDNIMIYWVTNSITTSMRFYAENYSKENAGLLLHRIPIVVPTASVRFGNDLWYQPDTIIKEKYLNLVRSTDYPNGGHFAPLEEPAVFADDLRAAVKQFEEFYKKN